MKTVKKYLPHLVLILIAIVFLVPLLWLVLSSLNPNASQSLVIPETLNFSNYQKILSDANIQKGFLNSIILSFSQTIIVMVVSVLSAYPLARYNLKSGQRISMGLLFLTSIPITAVMVPVYQMFIQLKLVDSMPGTILFMSAAALPYGIWMTKNFLDNVPYELEEAAWVDGASSLQSLLLVVLPLMRPGLFAVAIFTFAGSWGNFFVPFILLQTTSKVPAAVNIFRFFGQHGLVIYGELAAYSIIYMLPVFVLYFFSQKYMSQGFAMSGSTKG